MTQLGYNPNDGFFKNIKNIIKKLTIILCGTFKNIFRIDSSLSKSRMNMCNKCEYKDGAWCDICGCVLESKTRLENEECPLRKW